MSLSSAGPIGLEGLTSIGTPVFDRTEHRLLIQARNGDSRAFEKLVMPHRHSILRLATQILRNHEDAEDVVQLAFLKALRNLDLFRGNARFSTWLFRIAVNEALMMLRKLSRKYETHLDPIEETDEDPLGERAIDPHPSPEQTAVEQERRSVVRDAVVRLSPTLRTVMDLRYGQGLTLGEISVALGLPVSTVKARLHHARLRLTENVHVAELRTRAKNLQRRLRHNVAQVRGDA